VAALRKIANATPEPTPGQQAAERGPPPGACAREQVAALKRDLAASREEARPLAVQPRRLTDAKLIETYRAKAALPGAAGNLARARLAHLERQAEGVR
jgi:hypothetical protein